MGFSRVRVLLLLAALLVPLCAGQNSTTTPGSPATNAPPPRWRAVLSVCFTLLFAVLCAGVGVGGGAFYLSVFLLVGGMGVHDAIPLSKVVIFGVSVGSVAFLWRRTHPTAARPLIDFRLTALFEPLTLLGTVYGVVLNTVFPVRRAGAGMFCVFLTLPGHCDCAHAGGAAGDQRSDDSAQRSQAISHRIGGPQQPS